MLISLIKLRQGMVLASLFLAAVAVAEPSAEPPTLQPKYRGEGEFDSKPVLRPKRVGAEDDKTPTPVLRPKRIQGEAGSLEVTPKTPKAPIEAPPVIAPAVETEPEPVAPVPPYRERPDTLIEKVGPTHATKTTFSALLITPLGKEDTFDKRFTTIGGAFLLSFPIMSVAKNMRLDLEGGLALTISRLNLTQPAVSITHMYIPVPVRLRLLIPTSQRVAFELFAGGQWQAFEYDSRPTTDGGFHFGAHLDPDAGLGVRIGVGRKVSLRLIASYLYLAGGIELPL
jgi:hypothetical protein